MRAPRTGARRAALGLALLVASAAVGARGAEPAPARRTALEVDAPLPLPPSGSAGAPVDEAQAHFRRGVQRYAEGDPARALVELKRAYALVPSFRILFNLGQVAYRCGDHAAAFSYLTRYLTEGDTAVPAARRREVARDLADLRARVGFLSIEAKDAALRITVDDAEVGVTPLGAPIAANAGRRRIDLVAASGVHQTRTVELAAGEILSVPFAALGPPRVGEHAPAPVVTEAPALVAPLPVIQPPLAPAPQPAAPVLAPPPGPRPDRRARGVPWVTWTLAMVAVGGAAATGTLAWTTSRALHDQAATYPVRATDLQALHDRERRYALASDGFLAGAVLLSAVVLYLTLSRPSEAGEAPPTFASRGGW